MVNDAYSLLGIAPYSDTSANVNGANNIEVVSSEQNTGYSILIMKRLYDTNDKNGDEVITIKLNQQFCLALFTLSPNQSVPISTSAMHNYLKCIDPNIGLHFHHLKFTILLCMLGMIF
jgi:hypothetical protein